MTKVQAIVKVMENNGGIATWKIIYNEIEKHYPDVKSSKNWESGIRGVLYRDIKNGKNFKKIDEATYGLLDYDLNKLVLKEDIKSTQMEVVSKIRKGQIKFRENLLKSLKFCPLTNINQKEILVASHIKPWAFSNDEERLDINNGFIFTPTFDKLFDLGFITFSYDKKLLISKKLNAKTIANLGIKDGQVIEKLPIIGREIYLDYHFKSVFMG